MTAPPDGILHALYERLVRTGLPVFVGGAVAAMRYGEARSTLDIDLVVRAGPEDADRIIEAFSSPGLYVPHRSVIVGELRRKSGGMFNIVDSTSSLKADIYVAGDDPLIEFGFLHARDAELGDHTYSFPPAEYVIAMKLRYFAISHQDKHLRDIRSMLALSPDLIDRASVAGWAKRFGVTTAWEDCLRRPGDE